MSILDHPCLTSRPTRIVLIKLGIKYYSEILGDVFFHEENIWLSDEDFTEPLFLLGNLTASFWINNYALLS
jgi:hypothetical protein